MDKTSFIMKPIGVVHSCYKQKTGTPRQAGFISASEGSIEMLPPYNQVEAFRGLKDFSHIYVQWVFHQCQREKWLPLVRPPRLGGDKKMGVFGTRSTFRPNSLGLSIVKLKGIRNPGSGKTFIDIEGLDMIEGTPVLDIKPYVPYADRITDATAGFAPTAPPKKLSVVFSNQAAEICDDYINEKPRLKELITQIMQTDPRPAYKYGTPDDRMYHIELYNFTITFNMRELFVLEVLEIILTNEAKIRTQKKDAKKCTETIKTIYVDDHLVDEFGTCSQKYMRIRQKENEDFVIYRSPIKYFTYAPGYFYTLEIKEIQPNNGSPVIWELIRVVDKKKSTSWYQRHQNLPDQTKTELSLSETKATSPIILSPSSPTITSKEAVTSSNALLIKKLKNVDTDNSLQQKRILLTSNGLTTEEIKHHFIRLLKEKNPDLGKASVVYIPDAAISDGIKYTSLLSNIKHEFQKLGIGQIHGLVLADQTKDSLLSGILQSADAIYVECGNTFAINYHMQRINFDIVVNPLLDNGVVYVGSSAGTISAGKTASIALWKGWDDPKVVPENDYIGLDLANGLSFFPHYEKKWASLIEKKKCDDNHPVITLADTQAYLIDNQGGRVIGDYPGKRMKKNLKFRKDR